MLDVAAMPLVAVDTSSERNSFNYCRRSGVIRLKVYKTSLADLVA